MTYDEFKQKADKLILEYIGLAGDKHVMFIQLDDRERMAWGGYGCLGCIAEAIVVRLMLGKFPHNKHDSDIDEITDKVIDKKRVM